MKSATRRRFKKLRLSVTSRCNLFCSYCNPGAQKNGSCLQQEKERPAKHILNDVQKIHEAAGLRKVRLSGGEPTLRGDLPEIVRGIQALGIEHVGLTTNAIFLADQIDELQAAGLGSINISLDAVSPGAYGKITGSRQPEKSLEAVKRAIEKAHRLKIPVKLNAVICRGINEKEVLPLLDFALSQNLTLRYLELMQMGPLGKEHAKSFFGKDEILSLIQTRYRVKELGRGPSSTAAMWQITGAASPEAGPIGAKNALFGIIANHSEPFCHDCDRLRLDSRGVIYGCLSDPRGVMLEPASSQAQTASILEFAMGLKKKSFEGSPLHMKEIGG